MSAPVPLSYMIRESQLKVAEAIADWFNGMTGHQTGSYGLFGPTGMRAGTNPYGSTWDGKPAIPSKPWLPQNQVFENRDGNWFRITFHHKGWDPDKSNWKYGVANVLSNDLEVIAGHSYMLRNAQGVAPLRFTRDETVTLHNSVTESLSEEVKMDFGAKVTGTLGGTSAGYSLSGEISSAFGIKNTSGKSETEGKDITEKIGLDYTVPNGKDVLAEVSAPTLRESQQFDVNGYWDAAFDILWDSRWDGWSYIKDLVSPARVTKVTNDRIDPSEFTQVHFTSIDDFITALEGHNIYFPNVTESLVYFGIDSSIDDRRKVVWSGKETRVSQQNAEYTFKDVTHQSDEFLDSSKYSVLSGQALTVGE